MQTNIGESSELLSDIRQKRILIDKINKSLSTLVDKIPVKKLDVQKPFLKWVGGKTQLINDVLYTFPKTMNNYHEMFVGGGSVLFGILTLINTGVITVTGQIHVYDLNKSLINMYKHVQNNHSDLFDMMHTYIQTYDKCPTFIKGTDEDATVNRNPQTHSEATMYKENYYYWMRSKYNGSDEDTLEHAALFIVLNKTSFRGMYRSGPNGFNIPYGHYKTTPQLCAKDEFDTIHTMIQGVNFTHGDFSESFKNVESGDFVYLDPPYAPENKKSFVGYTADGFDINKHKELFKLTKQLKTKNVKFTMSNACVKLVTNEFKDYNIKKIRCRRAINAKNPGDTALEVLITSL